MGLFAKLRSRRQSSVVRNASMRTVEMLESRTMLNATLSSAVAPVTETPGGTAATIDLSGHFNDPNVPGTLVEVQTPLGNIPIALTDAQTPGTVANFKHYITSGEYNNVIFHRAVNSPTPFVLQGGGYTPDGTHINEFGHITGEPGISNTTGTVAMALSSGPNSGTSEWFINLNNNNNIHGPTGVNLDDTSDGGPFTVFGRVIYNGMSVANAIAALPQVAVAGSQTFSNVPVVNYSGSSTPASLPPASNLVVTNTVIVSPLTYSVSSDNPSLVNPSLSGSTLTLTPGAGTGIANITVNATDIAGNVASTTFQVGVGVAPATQLSTPLGAGGAKQVRFTDADGTSTIISLNGPGTATLNVTGSVAGQTLTKSKMLIVSGTSLQLASITATGTTGATTITITGHGGNGTVELGGITTDGPLKALNARTTALSGTNTINGAVGSVSLLSSPSGSLATTAIGHLTVKNDFTNGLNASSIGTFKAGSIGASTWNVTGNVGSISANSISNWLANVGSLGKLNCKGALDGSVRSAGNVGTVTASTLDGSVFAGFSAAAFSVDQAVPINPSTPQSITSIRVKNFVGALIAAETLGTLSLGQVSAPTVGVSSGFGVTGHTIKSLTASGGGKTLRLKNVTTQAQVDAAVTTSGLSVPNFFVHIV